MSYIPEDLRYAESHLWLERLDDGTIKVGITDFAQSELGDIVYVELPEEGASFTTDSECALVESVKSASDLPCPVAGEIIGTNTDLEDAPETINESPYENGWIFILRPEDDGEIDGLMDASGYASFIDEE